MIRMKENYYIKKYYGDFVLLKRAKNKENCKKVLEKVGVYGTLREVKEAIIKEMIKDEVNHRKTEPLYKLIPLMRQMYNRFYEENMECVHRSELTERSFFCRDSSFIRELFFVFVISVLSESCKV